MSESERGIPLIERTYRVRLPSGRLAEVNRFDLNLALAAGVIHYLQLSDTSWIKASNLTILRDKEPRP